MQTWTKETDYNDWLPFRFAFNVSWRMQQINKYRSENIILASLLTAPSPLAPSMFVAVSNILRQLSKGSWQMILNFRISFVLTSVTKFLQVLFFPSFLSFLSYLCIFNSIYLLVSKLDILLEYLLLNYPTFTYFFETCHPHSRLHIL